MYIIKNTYLFIKSITFFDSIVSFSINNELPEKSGKISNGGISNEEIDMRKGSLKKSNHDSIFIPKFLKKLIVLKKIARVLFFCKIKVENFYSELQYRKYF